MTAAALPIPPLREQLVEVTARIHARSHATRAAASAVPTWPMVVLDSIAGGFGLGRELFSTFRAMAGDAECGALSVNA